jgi:CYTH domain-containing protein
MSATRVFLLAPSLARLIERERGGQLVRRGYFPEEPSRSTHVQLEGETGHLVLVSQHPAGLLEDPTAISRLQAEALLELTAGQVELQNVGMDIGSHTAAIHRFISPGPLDLIAIVFKQDKAARKFQPPAWFGPEVTHDPNYQTRAIALAGLPSPAEVEVTDAALNSLLDILDNRAREPQPHPPQAVRASEASEPALDPEAEQEFDRLNIEDSVIRDLARSLQPQGR